MNQRTKSISQVRRSNLQSPVSGLSTLLRYPRTTGRRRVLPETVHSHEPHVIPMKSVTPADQTIVCLLQALLLDTLEGVARSRLTADSLFFGTGVEPVTPRL